MPGTRIRGRPHTAWQDNIKNDRAIVGESNEGNGGPFTMEKNCPRCSQTLYRQGENRTEQITYRTHISCTLVHALVSTRVDYCNSVLAAAPKTTTDKLQRVLNAAARVVSNTRKFDRGLSQLLHYELHWLDDDPDRVVFKLIVTVHRCLNGRAPNYLSNHVIPVSAIVSRQRLRSAPL